MTRPDVFSISPTRRRIEGLIDRSDDHRDSSRLSLLLLLVVVVVVRRAGEILLLCARGACVVVVVATPRTSPRFIERPRLHIVFVCFGFVVEEREPPSSSF